MKEKSRLLAFVAAFVLQIVGLGLFAKAFFPYKTILGGFASADGLSPLEPQYDRLVFVVIDALRSDFVFSNTSVMEFIQREIKIGHAIPFTAKATAPTVTLPRIKGLTTGSVPNFLDAILNIAESDTSSTLANQDSWVAQLHRHRGFKIHMYGDDTWIKLFPGLFNIHDGTSSFYVSDTVVVDHNVTRHIDRELTLEPWDAAILHYLGLDHVGHLSGPKSSLMLAKLKEMDNIVDRIFNLIARQDEQRQMQNKHSKPTLMIVCGDHGMTETGNHGGATSAEVSTALIFMSPSMNSNVKIHNSSQNQYSFYSVIDQIDLVPIISILLGLPIPRNNLGNVVQEAINLNGEQWIQSLRLNAHQLSGLVKHVYGEAIKDYDSSDCMNLDDAEKLSCLLDRAESLLAKDTSEAAKAFELYIKTCKDTLSGIFSSYDLDMMIYAIMLLFSSAVIMTWLFASNSDFLSGRSNILLVISSYCITLFASSYLEEEHQFWYYVVQSQWTVALIQDVSLWLKGRHRFFDVIPSMLQLVIMRILRRWNQTGNKYLGEWDFRESLSQDRNLAGILFLAALAVWLMVPTMVSRMVAKEHQKKPTSSMTSFVNSLLPMILSVIGAMVVDFKINKETPSFPQWLVNFGSAGDLILLARTIYLVLLIATIAVLLMYRKSLTHLGLYLLSLYSIFAIFLSRMHDAFLFALFGVQGFLLYIHTKKLKGTVNRIPYVVVFQMASFFVLGKSNSLASIDLSNAYNGISSYNTALVAVLTFSSNWAGPIWWSIVALLLYWTEPLPRREYFNYVIASSFLHIVTITVLSIAVTILRTHLFIWTVFSPKFLFQAAWNVLYHWTINVFLSGVMVSLYA